MGQSIEVLNRVMVKLHNSLSSLDGSKQGKDEIVPFEFAQTVSWNLTKNAVIVERAKIAYDREVRKKAREFGIMPGESIEINGKEAPNPEKLAKFLKHDAAVEELKDLTVTLDGLLFITLDELLNKPANADGKVLKNPIPQSVRNGLAPIIKEPETK